MRSNAVLKKGDEIAHERAPRTRVTEYTSVEELRNRARLLASAVPRVSTDFVDDNIRSWESAGLPDLASDLWPVLRRDLLGSDYEHGLAGLMELMRMNQVMKYIWAPEHYRFIHPEPSTVLGLHELERVQKGSIVFVPVDVSLRHAGRSTLDTRMNLAEHEFGLGAFEVGSALLWQRHSLQGQMTRMLCVGDTYRPGPGSDTKAAPTFYTEEHEPTSKGKIFFSRMQVEEVDHKKQWKIVTGFTPE